MFLNVAWLNVYWSEPWGTLAAVDSSLLGQSESTGSARGEYSPFQLGSREVAQLIEILPVWPKKNHVC